MIPLVIPPGPHTHTGGITVYHVHMMVQVERLGSFAEVAACVAGLGWSRSQLSMRLLRDRQASPDVRLPGQCPRPLHRVSGGTVPLWNLDEWSDFVREVKANGKSGQTGE
jgi:hypothetical protein